MERLEETIPAVKEDSSGETGDQNLADSPRKEISLSKCNVELAKPIKDILKEGDAFMVLTRDEHVPLEWQIKAILELGILGRTPQDFRDYRNEEVTPPKNLFDASYHHVPSKLKSYDEYKDVLSEVWKKEAKERSAVTWANIIGRDTTGTDSYFQSRFGVVYDLSSFTETMPFEQYGRSVYTKETIQETGIRNFRAKTFEINAPTSMSPYLSRAIESILEKVNMRDKPLTEEEFIEALEKYEFQATEKLGIDREEFTDFISKCKGKKFSEIFTNPTKDDGFIVGRRVAPRNFVGLLVSEGNDGWEKDLVEIIRINIEVAKAKNTKPLPIYSRKGDLLWPENLSHQQIVDREIHPQNADE